MDASGRKYERIPSWARCAWLALGLVALSGCRAALLTATFGEPTLAEPQIAAPHELRSLPSDMVKQSHAESIPAEMLLQTKTGMPIPHEAESRSLARELLDGARPIEESAQYYESLANSPIASDSVVVLDEDAFLGQCESPGRPPGISGPWPPEEYVCDGGDYQLPASVNADWTVDGVEQEDTIAHFDTIDGRTVVQPTNRVCIYAPRFGAVRRVDNLIENDGLDRAGGTHQNLSPGRQEELGVVTTSLQNQQPVGQVGTKAFDLYRLRQQGGEVARNERLGGVHDGLLPYEDFAIIRRGIIDQAEKPRLAIYTDAALVWTKEDAVQVMIKEQPADQVIVDWRPEIVYRFKHDPKPEIRVVKVASTDVAKPGEVIDFTLRFDNTGNETIGNVTLLDNLSTRLEYIAESQSCSVEADFYELPNRGGSAALRWDIIDPLAKGEGGVIRFRCRVR